MFEKLELTRMAQSLAAHAGARMGVIAQNIANADTPGYRTKDLADFATTFREDTGMRTTRATHLSAAAGTPGPAVTATGSGAPNGNDVSLEMEMVKSAEARQQHEMALAIYRATSGVIRASLGRNG